MKEIRKPSDYRTLFNYVFPNGNRIYVTPLGVTLWDDKAKRWVIDASCIAEDNEIRISKTQYVRPHPPAIKMSSLYKASIKKQT